MYRNVCTPLLRKLCLHKEGTEYNSLIRDKIIFRYIAKVRVKITKGKTGCTGTRFILNFFFNI